MTTASVIGISTRDSALPLVLDKFCKLFNELDKGNLTRLGEVYSDDIRFQDPFGEVRGIDELTSYFEGPTAMLSVAGSDSGAGQPEWLVYDSMGDGVTTQAHQRW